jgi:hypothetical protein
MSFCLADQIPNHIIFFFCKIERKKEKENPNITSAISLHLAGQIPNHVHLPL